MSLKVRPKLIRSDMKKARKIQVDWVAKKKNTRVGCSCLSRD